MIIGYMEFERSSHKFLVWVGLLRQFFISIFVSLIPRISSSITTSKLLVFEVKLVMEVVVCLLIKMEDNQYEDTSTLGDVFTFYFLFLLFFLWAPWFSPSFFSNNLRYHTQWFYWLQIGRTFLQILCLLRRCKVLLFLAPMLSFH